MQINRLFEMVYILLNKKQVTARELSERFEVSTRTIYRDIDTLCEAGVPIYTNKGKGGGIGLLDNFILNKSYLSSNEQQEILVALQSMRAATGAEQNEVLGKLSALFGNEEVDWIEVDFGSWDNNEKQRFETLKHAILDKKVVRFEYYNARMEKVSREVEPLQLSFKEKSWYLKGYCELREEMRLFKLSRIRHLECLEQHFERSLRVTKKEEDVLFNSARESKSTKLWIDKSQAYRIFDEFDEEQVVKDEWGNFIVEVFYPQDLWLYGYILSFGQYIKVLEPSYVRDVIKGHLKKAYELYEDQK